jgi:hypothetical protein
VGVGRQTDNLSPQKKTKTKQEEKATNCYDCYQTQIVASEQAD